MVRVFKDRVVDHCVLENVRKGTFTYFADSFPIKLLVGILMQFGGFEVKVIMNRKPRDVAEKMKTKDKLEVIEPH